MLEKSAGMDTGRLFLAATGGGERLRWAAWWRGVTQNKFA